jgi:folate-binding protein YgfZ
MPEVSFKLYRLITVSGTDAASFLQGQLTQDVGRLAEGPPLLAAWCNPKGRIIVTMWLISDSSGIGMILPDNIADAVIRRLTMYRLRATVEFTDRGDGWQTIVDPTSLDPANLVANGIPTIDASNTEAHTPHMLNLDKLDAISFDKGCYTGQEIVARTEHRGKSKRRMMRYATSGPGVLTGARVSDSERSVGEVVNVADRELLAVTPLEIHDQTLYVDTIELTPLDLPYDL